MAFYVSAYSLLLNVFYFTWIYFCSVEVVRWEEDFLTHVIWIVIHALLQNLCWSHFLYLIVFLFLYLNLFLFVYRSVFLFLCLSVFPILYLIVFLFVYRSVFPFLYLSISADGCLPLLITSCFSFLYHLTYLLPFIICSFIFFSRRPLWYLHSSLRNSSACCPLSLLPFLLNSFSNHILSYLCLILSYIILCHLTLSYIIFPYIILSYLIVFYLYLFL